MEIKKFKNGNLNIRYETNYDHEIKTFDDMVYLIANQTELNVIELSDPYCLGNAIGMAYDLSTVDGSYMIASPDFKRFKNGNVIKLYMRKESDDYV